MRLITEKKSHTGKRFAQVKRVCLFILSFYLCISAKGQHRDVQTKTVVIDAGHGGKDPGSVVGFAREKNVVLDIALKLGKLIKQNQQNIKVVYTRDKDVYIPLMDRAQIANKINADLFISIHANYCDNPNINGTETYVLGLHRTEDNLNVAKKENSVILLEDDYSTRYEGFNPNLSESYIMFELLQDSYLDQSVRFASILQSNFKELAQRHDREVRQAGFLVLRETAMPSVLIETGYLSNKKENTFLLSDAGRSEIAQSIYGSLLNYLTIIDAKGNLQVKSNREVKTENGNSQKIKAPKSHEKPQPKLVASKDKIIKKEAEPSTHEKSKDTRVFKGDSKKSGNTDIENKKTYAIQICVYLKRINPSSKLFKGISPIKELKIDGMYKYYCYESEDLKATRAHYNEVAKKFPDAFIVSIQNNQTKMVWHGNGKK